MANTIKRDWDYASPEPKPEKNTSITAHIVRSITVTMSITEMETLIDSMGVGYENLNDTQKMIQNEFANAVHALR